MQSGPRPAAGTQTRAGRVSAVAYPAVPIFQDLAAAGIHDHRQIIHHALVIAMADIDIHAPDGFGWIDAFIPFRRFKVEIARQVGKLLKFISRLFDGVSQGDFLRLFLRDILLGRQDSVGLVRPR